MQIERIAHAWECQKDGLADSKACFTGIGQYDIIHSDPIIC